MTEEDIAFKKKAAEEVSRSDEYVVGLTRAVPGRALTLPNPPPPPLPALPDCHLPPLMAALNLPPPCAQAKKLKEAAAKLKK